VSSLGQENSVFSTSQESNKDDDTEFLLLTSPTSTSSSSVEPFSDTGNTLRKNRRSPTTDKVSKAADTKKSTGRRATLWLISTHPLMDNDVIAWCQGNGGCQPSSIRRLTDSHVVYKTIISLNSWQPGYSHEQFFYIGVYFLIRN
jgi:hypothetical protein